MQVSFFCAFHWCVKKNVVFLPKVLYKAFYDFSGRENVNIRDFILQRHQFMYLIVALQVELNKELYKE